MISSDYTRLKPLVVVSLQNTEFPKIDESRKQKFISGPVKFLPDVRRDSDDPTSRFGRKELLPIKPRITNPFIKNETQAGEKINGVKAAIELKAIYETPKNERTPEQRRRTAKLEAIVDRTTFDTQKEFDAINAELQKQIQAGKVSFKNEKFE